MITFLVEKIEPNPEMYQPYIVTTATDTLPLTSDIDWSLNNLSILRGFVDSKYFQIKSLENPIENFKNCMYVLNIREYDDLTKTNIWLSIPDQSKQLILKHKIPIILWFPLEQVSAIEKEEWKRFLRLRYESGFSNIETILFSLSQWADREGKPLDTGPRSDRYTIRYVQSLSFLVNYAQIVHDDFKSMIERMDYRVKSLIEHDVNNKKYSFLTLNNFSRENRQLFLQSLYHNNQLWNNNIISCRHRPERFSWFHILKLIVGVEKKLCKSNQKLFFDSFDLSIDNCLKVCEDILNNRYLPGNDETIKFLAKLVISSQTDLYSQKLIDDTTNINEIFYKDWYLQSWFSVITETFNFNMTFVHESPLITEKTLKALLNFHPFVVFGCAGHHNYLNNLGFKTFEDFLNLPKDFSENNITLVERLFNLYKALIDFANLSKDEIQSRYNLILQDLQYNFDHLTNTDWLEVQYKMFFNNKTFMPIPYKKATAL